jgi:hypothetical protein
MNADSLAAMSLRLAALTLGSLGAPTLIRCALRSQEDLHS